VYGAELVVNGTFNTDFTGWTDVSTGTGSIAVVSGQAQLTRVNLNNRGFISQGITVVAGATYIVQITEVSGQAYVGVGTTETGTTFLGEPLATGENTFYITPNATSVYINVRGITDGVQLIDNVSVKEVTGGQVSGTPLLRTAAINEPRLEYDASGNPLGLLIEEARTNLFRYSQEISNVDHSLITTDNATVSPDGTQNASLCIPTSASVEHYIDDQAVIVGTDYAISCFAKYGSGSYLLSFRGAQIGSNPPQFNLQTGTVVNEGDSSVWSSTKIEDVGNGWYKCSSVGNPNGTSPFRFQILRSDAVTSFIGDGTGHYIWGAQVEQASFSTSYIPTSGSTVTRAADIASLPVERFAYSQAQGSLVFYSKLFAEDNTSQFIYALSAEAGNSNNTIRLYDSGTDNRLISNIRTNAANVATFNIDSTAFDSPFKVFQSYKVNDFSAGINGAVSGVDTGGAVPVNIKQLNFFSAQDSGSVASGHIKHIQYYPKGLSNEELQLLTQPSASPTMNLTFDGQATSTLVEGLHD
jgi:hypothetical protein